MKISNQNLSFNPATKTAKLENPEISARQFLKHVAADLVNTNGTVKSGYLRLNAGAKEVTVTGGHMGSGATAATKLVVQLVEQAYGGHASEALQTYLSNTSGKGDSVGKIGTQSFVALVRTLEGDALKEGHGAADQKLLTARVANHRLQTQHLQPLQAPLLAAHPMQEMLLEQMNNQLHAEDEEARLEAQVQVQVPIQAPADAPDAAPPHPMLALAPYEAPITAIRSYNESPRVLRRLQTLRRWSHEQEIESFFTRNACTRCAHGAGASWRVPLFVGCN
jgi:hypothetical protein